jgi:hypothetical protein
MCHVSCVVLLVSCIGRLSHMHMHHRPLVAHAHASLHSIYTDSAPVRRAKNRSTPTNPKYPICMKNCTQSTEKMQASRCIMVLPMRRECSTILLSLMPPHWTTTIACRCARLTLTQTRARARIEHACVSGTSPACTCTPPARTHAHTPTRANPMRRCYQLNRKTQRFVQLHILLAATV